MSTADDSGSSEIPDPLVTGRLCEPYCCGNLLIGHPRILLKKTNNVEVCSVDGVGIHSEFELYSIVSDNLQLIGNKDQKRRAALPCDTTARDGSHRKDG